MRSSLRKSVLIQRRTSLGKIDMSWLQRALPAAELLLSEAASGGARDATGRRAKLHGASTHTAGPLQKMRGLAEYEVEYQILALQLKNFIFHFDSNYKSSI